jgi:hypothetical protein
MKLVAYAMRTLPCDLFNYAASDDDTLLEDEDTAELTNYQHKNEVINSSERLTYGGHEDCNAYCLYATKKYKKGSRFVLSFTNITLFCLSFVISVFYTLMSFLTGPCLWNIHKHETP